MNIQVPADFTLDELLAYLRDEEEAQGYYTAKEWAAHFGIGQNRMMRLLHDACDAGVLVVSQAMRERIDGMKQPVPVYAFNLEEREAGDCSDIGEG